VPQEFYLLDLGAERAVWAGVEEENWLARESGYMWAGGRAGA